MDYGFNFTQSHWDRWEMLARECPPEEKQFAHKIANGHEGVYKALIWHNLALRFGAVVCAETGQQSAHMFSLAIKAFIYRNEQLINGAIAEALLDCEKSVLSFRINYLHEKWFWLCQIHFPTLPVPRLLHTFTHAPVLTANWRAVLFDQAHCVINNA